MPLFRVHVKKEYTVTSYAWIHVEADDWHSAAKRVRDDSSQREGLIWSEPFNSGGVSATASISPVTEEDAKTWQPPH